ncbi:AAA family ATPase [Leptolyngbya sp. ST-U4]|uniref:ATP-binding protein n=1 Tax=Leptolyngbya sp. ST-U4 TaxID=2933912 RepID=UPI00329A791A
MSQSNLAVQPPEEQPQVSQASSGASQPNNAPFNPARKLGKQRNRSPEQQAKVDQLRGIEPYVGVERDEELFTTLYKWWEAGVCGCITTTDRLGLKKSLTFYLNSHVKRRGSLLVTPAPVAYIEVEQNGSPTDLFLLLLNFLVNPLDCGHLRQLRSRTWGTLKSRGVKQLLVNNADLLSFKAFNELVRIRERLNISVVLTGSPYLNDIIDAKNPKKKEYLTIYNTFLKQHSYSTLDLGNVATVIQEWEERLNWTKPISLTSDDDVIRVLANASEGQLQVLYENLREVAIWKIDHPKAQINAQNVSAALGFCNQPVAKL